MRKCSIFHIYGLHFLWVLYSAPRSRTRNVTARRGALLGGPSDRIGANYSPQARHLLLRALR